MPVVEDPDNFEAPDALHVFTPDSQTCLVFKQKRLAPADSYLLVR